MFFKKRIFPQHKNINPSLLTALKNELDEPLSALNGLHDLLMRTELTKEQKRYVAASMDSTFKLAQTIQTMTELGTCQEIPDADRNAFESPKLADCNALVIESEILSARIFKHTLNKFEIKHCLVHNLPEAITDLEESFQNGHPFTHILVDEALHSVTPKESAEYIQAALQHTTHRPKLILTSRSLRNRSHNKVMSYGYASVLTKPLRETSLLAYLTHSEEASERQQGLA